jgi:hypothetical protein
MAKRARRDGRAAIAAAGPVKLRVMSGPGGVVCLNYGRPVAAVNLTIGEARAMAQALLKHAGNAERGGVDAAP